MPPKLAIGHTDSAGETVQRLLPNAKVIKTLNIVGNPHIIRPDFTNFSAMTFSRSSHSYCTKKDRPYVIFNRIYIGFTCLLIRII